jgi:hypothetical protein
MLRFTSALLLTSLTLSAAESVQDRIAVVTNTPGLVAFWDFTKREAPGKRFTAHVPAGAKNDYALDAGNYVKDLWNAGPSASLCRLPAAGLRPVRSGDPHQAGDQPGLPSPALRPPHPPA